MSPIAATLPAFSTTVDLIRSEHINAAIAKIGEKITLRRFVVSTKTDADAFGAYLHMGGRIGVLSILEGTTEEGPNGMAAPNPQYQNNK